MGLQSSPSLRPSGQVPLFDPPGGEVGPRVVGARVDVVVGACVDVVVGACVDVGTSVDDSVDASVLGDRMSHCTFSG